MFLDVIAWTWDKLLTGWAVLREPFSQSLALLFYTAILFGYMFAMWQGKTDGSGLGVCTVMALLGFMAKTAGGLPREIKELINVESTTDARGDHQGGEGGA